MERPWSLTTAEIESSVGSSLNLGLTTVEARRRLETEGRNELQKADGPGARELLARQFRGLVIWLLLGASAISAAVGEVADAAAIAAIVLLNALIGLYQEYRAERAVAALARLATPNARVIRDRRATVVPAAEVVRGDLLLLEAGDLVAARNYAFSTLVYAELLRAFGARSATQTFWSARLLPNYRLSAVVAASVALQILLQCTPALHHPFGLHPTPIATCLWLLVIGSVPPLALQARKAVIGRRMG